MRKLAENYYNDLINFIKSIRVTDEEQNKLDFYYAVEVTCHLITLQTNSGKKIMFIGNGASAAISSHMATDFWKNGGIRAVAFNDSSLLTCIGNDYGYEYVFEKPIDMFADDQDILFAISSSGKSKNILKGVDAAKSKGCKIITLSGFEEDNPLSSMGDINFYVPSQAYGPVEIIHQSIAHCILDAIIEFRNSGT